MTVRDPQFPFRQNRPAARVRLVCLPFAGGSALTYRTWTTSFPSWIDVCAVELPGHGTRLNTPQKATMEELVRAVLPAVTGLAAPIAIFGHSMGARLGFELCRALDPKPLHLFASGSPAPDIPRRRLLAHLPRAQLIAELVRMNPTSAEVYADAELTDLLLPIIRTDLAITEAYRGVVEPPVANPITVLTGSDDEDVTRDEARAWARCTEHPLAEPLVYEGGHFFLEKHSTPIRQVIVAQLEAALA